MLDMVQQKIIILDGKFGLMNIKNNKIIDTFENYDTVYDIDRKFYIQQKSDENTSMPQKYKKRQK